MRPSPGLPKGAEVWSWPEGCSDPGSAQLVVLLDLLSTVTVAGEMHGARPAEVRLATGYPRLVTSGPAAATAGSTSDANRVSKFSRNIAASSCALAS